MRRRRGPAELDDWIYLLGCGGGFAIVPRSPSHLRAELFEECVRWLEVDHDDAFGEAKAWAAASLLFHYDREAQARLRESFKAVESAAGRYLSDTLANPDHCPIERYACLGAPPHGAIRR